MGRLLPDTWGWCWVGLPKAMFASTSASHRSGYAGDLCHSGVSEVVFVKKTGGNLGGKDVCCDYFFDEKMGYDIFACFFFKKISGSNSEDHVLVWKKVWIIRRYVPAGFLRWMGPVAHMHASPPQHGAKGSYTPNKPEKPTAVVDFNEKLAQNGSHFALAHPWLERDHKVEDAIYVDS